ncbi:MAG: hypothetical protein A2V76_09045 [Candidatus Aminicenantes bacterium RBG_16_63_14]|nr:MAG: hypothetical protein A2V76_09045 [Candidatus Aminicenantes bacterium RBG_16_63_14]OGD28199.1 MAG: hypothetical protein A2V57_10255 [Candidatus Aminicenantes bacterium RBG_19FT_COMBO_65_30]
MIVVLVYLGAATGIIKGADNLTLALVFAIGPVAIIGVVSAAALLAFNLYTFPYIPADSGLVDLGPITGLWWLAVIVQFFRLERKARVVAKSAAPSA